MSDESSSVQVDEISSASTWKIENFDDSKSDVVSGLNTSSALLRNNQTKDSCSKKVNSTALSSSQVSDEQVSPYSTADSLARAKTGSLCVQTSQNVVESNPRDHAGSGRNISNLTPNCQQPNGGGSREMPRNGMVEKNRQSPAAIATTYWSGQSTSLSPYDRFQNPLAVISQSRQQNAERLASTTSDPGNVRIDRYSQAARVSQDYTEPRTQMPTGYPHVSTETSSNVWQIAGQTQKPSDTPSEFSQPGSQMPHGYFPSSSVNLEKTFHPPRRGLSGIFPSFSSFPGTVLPSSCPAGENYPSSPTVANLMPPHGPVGGRHSQSPSDIPAGYPATPARAIHPYPQSPPKVSSQSPQSYQTPDGYFSSTSLSPSSPYARTMQGYSPSNETYPSQSPVPPLVGNRYSHSSGSFTPVTFPLTSPYSSVSPQSPDNSGVSSQSPHAASSESVTSPHHQLPARSYRIPTGTSELYSIPSQSSANYPQTLYDHPDRCPMVSGIPTERCLQPALPLHAVPQNTLNHPRSPDCSPLRSSALPSARDGAFTEQLGNAARSSQLDPLLVNDLTQFPLQSEQRDLSSVYHVAQVKKSGEESLRPCQIGGDCRESQNTIVRSPVDSLDNNNQTANQFSFGQNKETRSPGSEMFALSHTISQHDCRSGNEGQNMNYESQTSDQTSQQIQEQTFNSMQNATVNTMTPTKNVSSTYVQARIILQNQLLEKQNHLQKVIQNQKAQLIRIQEQIILNAQAQFSINDIGDLESTKQLQQHVYDLEGELKLQETRQKDLKAIFVQKVGTALARESDVEMHSGGISSSNLDGVSFNRAGLPSVTSQVPDQSNNSYPGLSEFAVNVSMNIAAKAREIQCGSTDIENKRKLSPQDLNQEFAEEEDLFSGVLPHDKGKLPLSAHYSPVITPQYELSLNQRHRNSLVNASARENFASSSNQTKDYFSKFTASELETFLSSSSFPSTGTSSTSNDSPSSDDNVGKEEVTSPSTYDSLLLQQKRLLEMQEEQRRQLVRRQQEQLSRLQQQQRQQQQQEQQQQQQRMLLELQHTPENTQQEPHNLGSQILSHGDVLPEDTASSVLSRELSDEDLSVVNMLLAEEIGAELWTDAIFDKTTSAT